MVRMSEIVVSIRRFESREPEKYKLPDTARIIDLLEEMEFNPETVVVKRNGRIVAEEERLENADELELIPVVSGG